MRWSKLSWGCVLAVLFSWMAFMVLLGFGFQAAVYHASDPLRDEVLQQFKALKAAGAVDLDKAAALMGVPAYKGSGDQARQNWEEDVDFRAMIFLSDPGADRFERALESQSNLCFVSAGVGLFGMGAICMALRRRRAI